MRRIKKKETQLQEESNLQSDQLLVKINLKEKQEADSKLQSDQLFVKIKLGRRRLDQLCQLSEKIERPRYAKRRWKSMQIFHLDEKPIKNEIE